MNVRLLILTAVLCTKHSILQYFSCAFEKIFKTDRIDKIIAITNAMEVSEGKKSMSLDGSRVDEILPPSNDSSEIEKAMKGQPLQIIEISDEDHSFKLNEEALNKILSNDKVKDLPVCVVSVAGKFNI